MQGHSILEEEDDCINFSHPLCLPLWVFLYLELTPPDHSGAITKCLFGLIFTGCCVQSVLSLSILQILHLPLDVSAIRRVQGRRDGLHHLRVHQPLHQHQHHPVHLHPALPGSNFTAQPWGQHQLLVCKYNRSTVVKGIIELSPICYSPLCQRRNITLPKFHEQEDFHPTYACGVHVLQLTRTT